jgi:hypothetical protein
VSICAGLVRAMIGVVVLGQQCGRGEQTGCGGDEDRDSFHVHVPFDFSF